MDEVFEFGRRLQSDGLYSEAEKCYRRYLEDNQQSFKALNNLGVVLECQEQLAEAIKCFRAASELVPGDPIPRYNLGHALFRQERFDSAQSIFESLLESNPGHGSATLNLGVIHWRKGNLAAAESSLAAACNIESVSASANHKLGLFYFEFDRFVEARSAHLAAADIDESPEYHFHAALCDSTLKDFKQAAERFAHVIELNPASRIAHEHRVRALLADGQDDALQQAFEMWDEAIPLDPICEHMLAAYRNDTSISRCSQEYVRQTFSGFASDFNETLKRLDYQAPQSVVNALLNSVEDGYQFNHVLDAGCGTGLCGPYMKPHTKLLTGVDLAGPMLNEARPLNVYDHLIESDLINYLHDNVELFDAIISADTFNYFGALDDLLHQCSSALTPDGLLAFTLEQSGEDADNYNLMPHGRFQHARRYVENTVANSGFTLVSFDTFVLRKESDENVIGWIIQARKS